MSKAKKSKPAATPDPSPESAPDPTTATPPVSDSEAESTAMPGSKLVTMRAAAAVRRAAISSNLPKLMHQIIYATAPPIHTLRREVPEELEEVAATALQKDPEKRFKSGQDLAAALTRVHQKLRARTPHIDQNEQLAMVRKLKFFHDFSPAEIAEVLKASSWQNFNPGDEIVREGDMDDRFYIVVAGTCAVERHGRAMGKLDTGDCFGESSYLPGARRSATVRATSSVTLLKVGATLLEQASASCQLRFNRVFLRGLIERLQKSESDTAPAVATTAT
jgi:serine/threonine-protein kinase